MFLITITIIADIYYGPGIFMSQPLQKQEVVIIFIFAEEEAGIGNKVLGVGAALQGGPVAHSSLPLSPHSLCRIIIVITLSSCSSCSFSTDFPFIFPFDDFLSVVSLTECFYAHHLDEGLR